MEELTKYELARIIGARALQLSSGAPPLVKASLGLGFIDVAQLELDKGMMPLVVFREN
jgi:DNA-directed RNA polymerase subunit K/omega